MFHIADMMIIGSNMGIIDDIKKIKQYGSAEPEILAFIGRLKRFEENNMATLKNFS